MNNKKADRGIIRKVDKLGRIVIPIEMRKTFEIKYETPMEIFIEKDSIILKKCIPMCIFCENVNDLVRYENRLICQDCIKKIANEIVKK